MASVGSLIVLASAIWTASASPLLTGPNFCVNRPKPWTLSYIKPELYVYTRDNSDQMTVQNDTDIENFVKKLVTNGYLTTERSVTFLVHGYFGYTKLATWLPEVKDALLKIEDTVVILVDWAKGADVIYNYGKSASNTEPVADMVAKVALDILSSSVFNGNGELLYLHCIGHSLGAHVCGQAGRTAKIFDRASGLDPAGPGFEGCSDHLNIDTDSADCVDNIHTDGTHDGHWNPIVPYFGTLSAWGHMDFYPNGGGNQPGCFDNDIPDCSHTRSIELFAYALETGPDVCTANKTCDGSGECDNYKQPFGYYSSCHRDSNKMMKGSFFLTTGPKKPFC